MCGFFAIIQDQPRIELAAARRALDSLAHRGPDAGEDWVEGHVYLGHRRLSIIDLETGGQPMFSHDGRYGVIFNGEIYNFLELRDQLSQTGARFKTRSDTEVLLEGYRRWGAGMVQRINGMFAFLIWDRQERSVFGARDRLGIKPFCWALRDGVLITASSLEPFSALGGFRSLDPVAVRDLMTFDYIPAPRTIFQGVHKLMPGSTLQWSFGQREPRVERYWSPPAASEDARAPEEGELENLLDCAVKRQMISDVPIGAFLSGGIDSSLLVAFMARHSSTPVRTFSVSFKEAAFDESSIARLVAERFGTSHTVIEAEEVGSADLLGLLGRLDEPFCDSTYIPTFLLSAMTRKHVKVALSGDGGDEVFGGYPKYLMGMKPSRSISMVPLMDRSLRLVSWRPRGVGHLYEKLLTTKERIPFAYTRHGDFPVFRKDLRQLLAASYQQAAVIGAFFQPWLSRAQRYGRDLNMDVLMRTDLETYLSENCLVKVDRASMLASLEVRVPYLDEIVLDRILPLPAKEKIVNGSLKALLQPLARRLLPREVWDRPKQGFTVPLGNRLAKEWRPALESALEWGEANLRIFDYAYLRRLQAINLAGSGASDVWNPFVIIAWSMAHGISF